MVRIRREQGIVHEEEVREGSECYFKKYLKEKLIDHYGHHIYFCENHGIPNLLSFKGMAACVLKDFKKKGHQNANDATTAGRILIKSDRKIPLDKSTYPSLKDMSKTDY